VAEQVATVYATCGRGLEEENVYLSRNLVLMHQDLYTLELNKSWKHDDDILWVEAKPLSMPSTVHSKLSIFRTSLLVGHIVLLLNQVYSWMLVILA
jgi:hypothetical protein